jgi:hypothetical protein
VTFTLTLTQPGGVARAPIQGDASHHPVTSALTPVPQHSQLTGVFSMVGQANSTYALDVTLAQGGGPVPGGHVPLTGPIGAKQVGTGLLVINFQ